MNKENTTHSPLTSAYDLGEQTRIKFLETLTGEQKMLLEKMQYCRKDVREFAPFRNTCEESDALVDLADGFADFTDVDVNQR